jgi:hypothetical protein|tara:strand:- start:30 stop:284 length:255 start_codon:yes stop_codon:yes gene_type:complete
VPILELGIIVITPAQKQKLVIGHVRRGDMAKGKAKPNNPKLWAAKIRAAKQKFDVYPSAYANAWASKQYKKAGGTWSGSDNRVS